MKSQLDISRLLAGSFVGRVEHYAVLPSTQDRAREAASNPFETLPLLVIADEQSAGRGRGDNAWWTGAGNLALSLLFDPAQFGCPRRAVPSLSLAVSVAIVDAVAPRIAGHRIGLHWPNDVVADGRKLAGVLVEILPDGRHILGVGLNTNSHAADAPAELQSRLTTLLDLTSKRQDHTEVILDILNHLDVCLRLLGADGDSLGVRYNDLCLQHGEALTLYLGANAITGPCLGIASDGGLLLDAPDGPRAFYSGTLQPPKTMDSKLEARDGRQ
ncbi:MAG TPA: biotin--[acetyl-CoA-carboxylase] ligase [Pirellulales bacterium]|jgi:BirA family biotin operon repressor/biotin-[acetyl-CoA-carboxylase] ligase|nr:biotin--[acetyl-CoA-carboxylase] ligase [Pirellulales bacterium]